MGLRWRMGIAVALQILAAVGFMVGAFLAAGAGGVVMASALLVFLVGWQLEQRLGGS